jgi:hypothetical protein
MWLKATHASEEKKLTENANGTYITDEGVNALKTTYWNLVKQVKIYTGLYIKSRP